MKFLIRATTLIIIIWALFTTITLGWQWKVRQQKARAEGMVTELSQARNELLQQYALLKDWNKVDQLSEANRDRQQAQLQEKLMYQLDKEISISSEALDRVSQSKREESRALIQEHNQIRLQRKEQVNNKSVKEDFSGEEKLLERYFTLIRNLD